MKKKIFLAVLLLLTITATLSFNQKTVIPQATSNTINISVEHTDCGSATITYYDAYGTPIESNDSLVNMPKGSRVTLQAKPKDGYRFICWLSNVDNNTLNISNKENVTFSELTKDYHLKPYYVAEENFAVIFYPLTGQVVLSIQEISKGGNANTDINIPKMDGVNFQKWDHDVNNIMDDVEIRPIYKSSVWSVFRDYYPLFFKGLGITLLLSVIAVALALFFGAALCLMRLSENKILSILATSYIEVIRGIPLLLQLLVIYMLVPRIELGSFLTTEVVACILALFLNSAAYIAEIFRSGIQAVDKGQMEAARALGLGKWQAMLKIVIPQGFRNSLPSIGNELIAVIKETSLASTVDASIGELMSVKKAITSGTFINIEPFIVIAIMYFSITFSLSKLVRFIERRLDARD